MRTIHKYRLELTGRQEIDLPLASKVVHFGEQYGDIFIWAEIFKGEEVTVRVPFFIFGTGHVIPDGVSHVATVQMKSGYVWHLYMEKSDAQD